jgi:hypothetical protein
VGDSTTDPTLVGDSTTDPTLVGDSTTDPTLVGDSTTDPTAEDEMRRPPPDASPPTAGDRERWSVSAPSLDGATHRTSGCAGRAGGRMGTEAVVRAREEPPRVFT